MEPLLSDAQWQDQKQQAQTETQEVTSGHQETSFHCDGDRARVAQRGGRVSIFGDIQLNCTWL